MSVLVRYKYGFMLVVFVKEIYFTDLLVHVDAGEVWILGYFVRKFSDKTGHPANTECLFTKPVLVCTAHRNVLNIL